MDLSAAVLELVEDARDLNESLHIEHAVQPGVQVKADADLLQQVLQNLLSNAAKYNQPGGRIRFELTANATHASLRVGNTGPGIPEAARTRIFERFFRADPSRSREIGGAGLGLSLSRELVRAHGGELELEPATEAWTWFQLRLPPA
jgi:signal transduction histidine kinase